MRELDTVLTWVIYGVLWAVIPWEPLTAFDSFAAAVSLLAVVTASVKAVRG